MADFRFSSYEVQLVDYVLDQRSLPLNIDKTEDLSIIKIDIFFYPNVGSINKIYLHPAAPLLPVPFVSPSPFSSLLSSISRSLSLTKRAHSSFRFQKRWCPTPEQLMILDEIERVRTPKHSQAHCPSKPRRSSHALCCPFEIERERGDRRD